MKTTFKILLVLLSLVLVLCGMVACGGDGGNTTDTGSGTDTGNGGAGNGDTKLNFTTIVFDDLTVDYDGGEHTIVAGGVPEGAVVTYTSQGPYTDAGEYTIGVKVTMDGYNDYSKNVTLKINKIDFVGITFEDIEVDYDGNEHRTSASGIPDFATVTYTNEGPFVDAGEYTTTIAVTNKNYNDFVKSATVKINKIDFVGITFENDSFEYDGNSHEITITGALPSTASVTYSCEVEGITNSAIDVGSYVIVATIKDKNHNDLVLSATLKITANDEERIMAFSEDGVLFFQNAMDDNEFYLYDTNTGDLKRISGESVKDMVAYEDGVIYVSSTAFITSVKSASYSEQSVSIQTLNTEFGIKHVQVDGNTIYYVINGLTNGQSGIYKMVTGDTDPVITCLSQGKAYYLQLAGDNLYFADGANGKKLSVINTTDENQSRTLVVDEKINNLVYDNGNLYYTVNNLLGDYIEKYAISSQVRRKLTVDAGASLTVVGNKLYYVNVDKFTTSLIGKGIYVVGTNPLVDYNVPGSLVVEGGDHGVCSLAEYDGCLYYYDVNGYKLMEYNFDTEEATNLLEGFVKPEDPTPISTGSKLVEYGGCIYYLDIWDGKVLRCYNPQTKSNYAVTTDKVADFNFIGDTLYVNMVSYLINNDVYSANLKTGGVLTKISTYSAYDFVSDGEYLYYIEENAGGVKTAIHQCKLDGTEDVIIYDKGVTNLRIVGGNLYFVDGSNIHVFGIESKTDTTIKVDNKEIHTTVFDTDGTYIYYRDMYGVVWMNKRLARCRLDGSEKVILAENVDPTIITYTDGMVYFYSDTLAKGSGLFSVSANSTQAQTPTEILNEDSGLYGTNFVVVGDKVYFVDYKDQLSGKCHLFEMTIGQDPTQVR